MSRFPYGRVRAPPVRGIAQDRHDDRLFVHQKPTGREREAPLRRR